MTTAPGVLDGPSGPVESPAVLLLLGAASRQTSRSATERAGEQTTAAARTAAPAGGAPPPLAGSAAAAAAVNKAPTAVADGPFKTVEDTALTITAAQLVGNDTDPNSG
ncbi:hypothetical protein, partial [Mycolicibacterium sp. F2034L]|uniref:hypothetical protein n=1 Tax=Mycolicibacterium sp. F2034L TaxID=2926422 RepID=UPI001FF2E320